MNSCCVLLFLLSLFCIKSTQGSRSFIGAQLHKRQAENDVCDVILIREACINGLYENYADTLFRCNYTVAGFLQDFCRRNSMGNICGSLIPDYGQLQTACGPSPTTCTSDCREFLATTRARLGCCVNALNISSEMDSAFRYPLWSLCGLEPVTEQCTSSFDLPTSHSDLTCTEPDLYQQLSRAYCRAEYVEPIRDVLRATGGCQDSVMSFDTTCRANQDGFYCELLREFGGRDAFTAAAANCADTSVCDPRCIQSLNSIVARYGCCFTEEYNRTTTEWLSYEFWQQCGLTPPGACEVRLSNAAIPSAPEKTIALSMGLLLMAMEVLY